MKSDCKPRTKLLEKISCEIQAKIEAVQAEIKLANPHRDKISEHEAIIKMLHAYPIKKAKL